MRAEVSLRWAEPPQFANQLFAILHVCVVRLVGAEKTPDRPQLAPRLIGPHTDGDRTHRVLCLGLCGNVQTERTGRQSGCLQKLAPLHDSLLSSVAKRLPQRLLLKV